ncbi:MAG: branched-chain amino acid aminotransferase [Clostridiales Family XIII bacterium]|jgi:branched-chain amino acid aminotransferase|nr:branched-chain amino acid aminotransferase [Clostridiales Family XIII bacterium]
MNTQFKITKTDRPKQKPDPDTLEFGTVFTDHMFLMDYNKSSGWHDGRIVPYGPISLDPAAAVLHYSQTMFEGLKAYRAKDGSIQLFRPDMNAKRTTLTNARLCIPPIDEDLFVNAIKAIVDFDREWTPNKENTSLYVRPFIFANEAFLGVRPAEQFIFVIILSPVGSYYKSGLAPTKIFVEDEYVRAVAGGTGFAKIGGNYAMSLKSQEKAHAHGFSQVLWLDGVERKYVEEIGTSNAFFVIGGEIFTAPLTGSILPGITRDSVITLLREWGFPVREERFSIQDIYDAHEKGQLDEVFATGTATVISPVGLMRWSGREIIVNNGNIGHLSQKLYDEISGIQTGLIEDRHGWIQKV